MITMNHKVLAMSRTFRLPLLLLLAGIARADGAYKNLTDGLHSCGGVEIPYPFGIADHNGKGDFRKGFDLRCEAGKPVLANRGQTFTIGNFSINTAEARVWLPVAWQCYNSSGDRNGSYGYTTLQFRRMDVYRISNAMNYFFVLGCSTLGILGSQPRPTAAGASISDTRYDQLTGCLCYCNDYQSAASGVCSGVGCCHADVPPDLVDNAVHFDDSDIDSSNSIAFSSCDYAFLAEKDYYTFDTADLNMDLHRSPGRLMPVRLDWAIRDSLTCKQAMKNKETYACISSNSRCVDSSNGPGYFCNCRKGYEGNPYILNGCSDINECEHRDQYPCEGLCVNKQGSYECTCPKNLHSANPFKESCISHFPLGAAIGAAVGLCVVIVIIFLLVLSNEKRKIRKHFEKNGGLALAKLNNIKLFTKEDLKKIRRTSNIIGSGGFGKVYKGCIEDSNQLVAVKEPINGNAADKDQFVNEISIQSRVIHKNIVKLIGCCLEVDVPILVYEFVPNGSLHDILHGDSRMPLNMGLRLQIAAESAEGLAYMHSKTTTNILHGDVKPANILLNEDFMPKISDFGISRLIVTDMQHTGRIIGDMSYVDPIYLQTGLLTNKSDVYSFGVVLLELITRKKASHSDNNSLLRSFSDAYTKDKSVTELVDKDLAELDDPELINSLTVMINQCLNLDVNQRPEMTDVAERLHEMVRRYHSK